MFNNSARSRRWVFTLNNPSLDDLATLNGWPYRYMVWQKERGESGTPHYQGFVIFHQAKSLSVLKTKMHDRAHWEMMRGTLEQNIKYCSKDEGRIDGPWIRGAKPRPGKRSDLDDVSDMIVSGMKMRAIARAYPTSYIRYNTGMYSLQREVRSNVRTEPKIFILTGPPGCGKTRLVYEVFPDAYWKPKGKWWDGYDGHEVVVLDEFYSWIPLDELLRLLDRYPLLVQTKGGMVRNLASVFVFTSNLDPLMWYSNMTALRTDALRRRFKDFGELYSWNEEGGHFDRTILL